MLPQGNSLRNSGKVNILREVRRSSTFHQSFEKWPQEFVFLFSTEHEIKLPPQVHRIHWIEIPQSLWPRQGFRGVRTDLFANKFGFGFKFIETRMVLFPLDLPSSPFQFVWRRVASVHVPFVGPCTCVSFLICRNLQSFSWFLSSCPKQKSSVLHSYKFWEKMYPCRGEILLITPPGKWV